MEVVGSWTLAAEQVRTYLVYTGERLPILEEPVTVEASCSDEGEADDEDDADGASEIGDEDADLAGEVGEEPWI